MIACLNPCDQHIEENLSTLSYASKASFISNKPIKNEDPKLRQIEELKLQVAHLTEELSKANQTIEFLSSVTGQNPELIKKNIANFDSTGNAL
jgi:kinesin family protein 4/21/27